jgi:uncharacterized protein YihD (DUF1040 family)
MKVKELIELLEGFDPELPIVMSRDQEGNGYEYLRNVADDATFDGEDIYLAELTDEHKAQGYTDEDVRADEERVVVFWP